MILSLVNQHYAVSSTLKIRDLSDELKRHPDVWAVGVVNEASEPVGIIVTSAFQEKMSRPFSHDVFDKKPVVELMTDTPTFPYDKNIYTIAEELASEVRKTANQYFLVTDGEGKFAGIFSTKDLLIHQFNEHLQDIEVAITIQQSVVPEVITHRAEGIEVYALSTMAKGVGGDFVAVKSQDSRHWLLAVCDVSGKGVAASLVTASLGGMFAQFTPGDDLPGFVSQVNEYMLNTFHMEKYFTGAVVAYDAQTRQALVCDMGHSYVGVVRGDQVTKTAPLNPFVGFVPNLQVHGHPLTLEAGDLLFIYTDGFVEQKGHDGTEFGIEAFEGLLGQHSALPLSDLAALLHQEVQTFRGDQPRGDDEAILLARVV